MNRETDAGAPQPPEGCAPATPIWSDEELSGLFTVLRAGAGVDFTYYKKTTIRRRIGRRMALHGIPSLGSYVAFLERSPSEVQELCQDLLIKVTSFFRDPETFETLKTSILPEILHCRSAGEPVRIWVPGCATGEEVYSIAIALSECFGDADPAHPIQIFGTDISEAALQQARAGMYPEANMRDVSPERLRRFFVRRHSRYQISKSIRDLCIFARQNAATDPPFSRLDLISCRNLLIYLEPLLQRSVLSTFHYALKPSGFLMLGTAEGVGAYAELFAPVNRAHKIFRRVPAPAAGGVVPAVPAAELARSGSPAAEVWGAIELQRETDQLIMAQYAPPGVVVDDDMQILQLRGRVGPYLEPASGDTGAQLLRIGREGLAPKLRAAIDQAQLTGELVRREGGSARIEGELRAIDLEVWPLKTRTIDRRCYLVMFLDGSATVERDGPRAAGYPEALRHVRRLERELSATRAHLLSVIDDRDATNEELKSATEQILSSNAELHALNEQLETAAAEIMSSNEELATLNDELKSNNAELSQANADLRHVLTNCGAPLLLLDAELRIRRFTPSITQVLSATPADVGRHVGELRSRTSAARIDALAADVIRTARGYEAEVRSEVGPSYRMRISPCRGGEDRIDGALICWFERISVR